MPATTLSGAATGLRNPGDAGILGYAHRHGRVLVTLDKDFGELAFAHGMPHAGILRLVGIRAQQQAAACRHVLDLHGDDLRAGAIVTVEPGRLRIRMPPRRDGPYP